MDIKVGSSFRMYGSLYHVRAIVDEDYAVVRYYSRVKRRWVYSVESVYFVSEMLKG